MMDQTNRHGEIPAAPARRTYGSSFIMMATRVLILEDSLIIAMEAEEILREIGAETVDIVGNMDQAIEAINGGHYDCAMLDVNLGEQMSFDFARLLMERGIAFGFVSGYSDTQDFPNELQNVPLLVKPFNEGAMLDFLNRIFPGQGAFGL
jgi:CheY-like chemotaxis protein